jgi:hypothetical protein
LIAAVARATPRAGRKRYGSRLNASQPNLKLDMPIACNGRVSAAEASQRPPQLRRAAQGDRPRIMRRLARNNHEIRNGELRSNRLSWLGTGGDCPHRVRMDSGLPHSRFVAVGASGFCSLTNSRTHTSAPAGRRAPHSTLIRQFVQHGIDVMR